MKYIALLSGGKDSCYNLVHCHKNGHELVAAASLGPEHEELDSYLYQTVGQDAIEFVARALDVPLYRRVISGIALAQGSEYGSRNVEVREGIAGDETEDLYTLLADVKSRHPDANGVSVGAILSNYQRVRVEHVCQRLSLTPLSYLWQRDQADLLSEMIAAGMEAVLIKVAGIGLTTKHLGKTLPEMQATLVKLNSLYGSHICGEGGEYETLTLDCPLFKQRITLLETEVVIHSDNDFATVAFLRIKHASLDPKPKQSSSSDIVAPALFDPPYRRVSELLQARIPNSDSTLRRVQPQNYSSRTLGTQLAAPAYRYFENWIAIGNVHRDAGGAFDMPLEDEVRECFHILQQCLSEHSLSLFHITNMNIFISSMEDFASLNAVYATYFGVSPPARACVAVDLPHPLRITFDCVAYAGQSVSGRKALHVQGLSYWAPANIGPYSQAILADERIFVSGQIGLIPSSLTIPSPRSLATEIPLVSQHADRIVKALSDNACGGWEGHSQLFLYWLTQEHLIPYVVAAAESIDVTRPHSNALLSCKGSSKGRPYEKQVLYHTGHGFVTDEDGDTVRVSCPPIYGSDVFAETDIEIRYEVSYLQSARASCAVICGRGFSNWAKVAHRLKTAVHLEGRLTRALSLRLFYKVTTSVLPPIQSLFGSSSPAITPIPCHCIRSRDQKDWDYALNILTA
ncbi:hypothetical protein B0F90DRAFT_1814078 [Multifurca ochricompacta]|uniref:Diphthine--ammonia ligase n=1 Tax=Multifurca ochricompacta TaxID=376703 RepID=A0AAD4QSS9_9AGAM|nr:hypothetical protein B0F90DRAFT_1814078 [Multifurca ochricompacta]